MPSTVCPQGHRLRTVVRAVPWTCDVCSAARPPQEQSAYCSACDFDDCYRHVEMCPSGHTLTHGPRPVRWTCSVCKCAHPAATESRQCVLCNYNCCARCRPSATPIETTVPVPLATVVPREFVVPVAPQPFAAAASMQATVAAIDAAAATSGFRCVPVSWEDAQRGTVGGALSCWGANISDVRLWAKSGKQLYTLRTNNWNERLGYVSSKDVAVVVGNHAAGGATPASVTLERYLKNVSEYAGYAGVQARELYAAGVDELLTIRFQTVFLPIASTEALEFCTEVYNYNTRADDDPRNLLLLATAQGTSVQQDGASAKRVYLHMVDPSGVAHRYWLEGERSAHAVGGAQVESEAEKAAAAARGKATAMRIGTRAMGTRFNVQMLIQLPLQQKPRPVPVRASSYGGGGMLCAAKPKLMGASFKCEYEMPPPSAPVPAFDMCMEQCASVPYSSSACESESMSMMRCRRGGAPNRPATGTSNAARVSRGNEVDVYPGVANKLPQRDASQHGTITVTMYYTVAGGVPSVEDVRAAIADLEALYAACPTDKRLVNCGEVTAELTVAQTQQIGVKLATQPYKPSAVSVPVDNGFPE